MTQVTIRNDHGITKITVVGHAGYEPGHDVVCAGISTLTYSLMNMLARLDDSGQISDFDVMEKPGDIRISFKRDPYYRHQINAVIDFFLTGIDMMSEEYPDYVELLEE